MRWLDDGITDSNDMNLSKLQEIVKDRKPGMLQPMGLPRVGHDLATEQRLQHQQSSFHVVSAVLSQKHWISHAQYSTNYVEGTLLMLQTLFSR